MAFKLVIDNKVGVNVVGKLGKSDGKEQEIKFVLVCDRLTQQELTATYSDGKPVTDFFREHARDWRDQTIVVDEETGEPAKFSAESLEALLSIGGMGLLCWQAYVQQVQATPKNLK